MKSGVSCAGGKCGLFSHSCMDGEGDLALPTTTMRSAGHRSTVGHREATRKRTCLDGHVVSSGLSTTRECMCVCVCVHKLEGEGEEEAAMREEPKESPLLAASFVLLEVRARSEIRMYECV
ncbi:Hypothetical predicted protein [Podarcis lilfordi]|uniref:Uncharacterized protein n=1 Tax=Podarcis lilfordi TaxID=74358 RepID=A0AA35K348_9SAUR|nr:Hypothetical predicted protein [Podarcis lilfordi]